MMPLVVDPRSVVARTQGGSGGSSFGSAGNTFGLGWQGHNILQGERYELMQARQSYYQCTQHNTKKWDFDGRAVVNIRVGTPGSTGLVGMEKPANYIPMSHRKPSAPLRLAKLIVDRFTSMIFSEDKFPHIRVDGDPDTEDFAQALSTAGKLPLKMLLARNIGGSTGSVGLSWCFQNGSPKYGVHNPKNIYIHSWDDRMELIPRHVSEVYLYYEVRWDPKKKCFANIYYWFRRDWTPDWDIVFKPVLFNPGQPTFWEPDPTRSFNHQDGICHFTWIQNLPSEEIDGVPDYDGLYDKFDEIDIIASVMTRGIKFNLDPTLVLKVDPDYVKRSGIMKGSEHSLTVGKDGDASYLALPGDSVDAGMKVLDRLVKATLDESQCVLADPDKLAAQGTSSVALKMIYGPMTAKSSIHREQYGTGIERLLEPQIVIARKRSSVLIPVLDAAGNQAVDEQSGQPLQAKEELYLPPRIETNIDPETGKETIKKIPRDPGEGGDVNLQWPAFFPPTVQDQNLTVTTLQLATGGKAFLSKKTAVDIVAQTFGIDPAEEQRRIESQSDQDKADESEMTPPGMGGEVKKPDELPEGALPRKPKFLPKTDDGEDDADSKDEGLSEEV